MSRPRTWLLGCGLGCLAPLVLLIILGVAVNLGGGKTIKTRQTIEETLGTAADFTPWLDGRIPADRLERFLAVRRELADSAPTGARSGAQLPEPAPPGPGPGRGCPTSGSPRRGPQPHPPGCIP